MKRAFCLSIIVFFIFVFGSAFSQTLDEIIAKNLQSKGGIEKLKALKSVKMIGKVMAQGMEMPFVMYFKRPNLARQEAEFQGQKIVSFFDGEKAWMINPFMGSVEPMELPKEQAELMKNQADVDGPFIGYKEKGIKLELIGKEDVEGTPAYKIKVTYPDGKEKLFYLETSSCLKIKTEETVEIQGNPVKVGTLFSDYKEVEGLKFPFAIQSMTGQLIFEAIEINPELADSLFKVSK